MKRLLTIGLMLGLLLAGLATGLYAGTAVSTSVTVTVEEGLTVVSAPTSLGPLVPGEEAPLSVTLHNPTTRDITVRAVSVPVTTLSDGSEPDFSLVMDSFDVMLPAGADSTVDMALLAGSDVPPGDYEVAVHFEVVN